MDFIQNMDSIYLVFGLLFIFLIGHLIIKRQKSLKLTLQYRLIFYGVIMFLMLFYIPSTPSLSTFGYPEDITDIEKSEKLLKLLQNYNDAIVKTTEVVHWMIFITVFWLVSIISSIIKHFKLENSTK